LRRYTCSRLKKRDLRDLGKVGLDCFPATPLAET